METGISVATSAFKVVTGWEPRKKKSAKEVISMFFLYFTVWFEPTDVHKAGKPFRLESGQQSRWEAIAYSSPNLAELNRMVEAVRLLDGHRTKAQAIRMEDHDVDIEGFYKAVVESCLLLLERMDCVLVTLGKKGIMVTPYIELIPMPFISLFEFEDSATWI